MRKKDSLLVTFRALLYLLGVKRVLGRLVDVDFAKELSSNKQLAAASATDQSEYRARLRESTVQRAVLLRRRLIVCACWIIGAAAVGVSTALVGKPTGELFRPGVLLGVLSIVSFSIATLGRLGWSGQSFKGDTVFEQLDNRVLWVLYGLGTALGVGALII